MNHERRWWAAMIVGLFACVGAALAQQAPAAPQAGAPVLIIYDSSNSMWGELSDSSRKYEAGRTALSDFLKLAADSRPLGFRAYGHRRASDCRDSELVVPFQAPAGAKASIDKAAGAIRPTGKTPIRYSLAEGQKDFAGRAGDILLISDGIETCDADPCDLVREWRASNVNIRVHVVGVGLTAMERTAMSCIADASGGRYFDANSASGLTEALASARSAIGEPSPPPNVPAGYQIRVTASDAGGRSYVAAGRLFGNGKDIGEIRSHDAASIPGPGDYAVEVGPVLHDGTIYKPVRKPVKVDRAGTTTVDVTVVRPAIVSARFVEAGTDHRGSNITAWQDGKAVFVFRPLDEALARPGEYEFRAAPNPDNQLTARETLREGQHTQIVFELSATVQFQVVFKLPGGQTVRRNSELWRNGEKVYGVHSANGGLVRPGAYTLYSDDPWTPLAPREIEIKADGQVIEVPLEAGFVRVVYPASEDYLRTPDRAFLAPIGRAGGGVANLNRPIALAPGRYSLEGQSQVGYFDPQEIIIVAGRTVEVTLRPKALGQVIVDYAPSNNYKASPDRASLEPLDGQPLISGFMRPGEPLKALPGRYRVEGRSNAGDITPQDIVVRAHETTSVTLKLRSGN